MIPRFAGRFELLRRLGKGGMGEVFLARDLATGAECALKRLVGGTRRFSEMRREFEVLTRVRHPAVVSVLELGVAPDGTPYYTMEYVPGLSADRALASGDWPALYFVAAEVAHGLEALHDLGIVHGDLKPSNLLVIPGGPPGALPVSVRLLDFGLAVVLSEGGQGHRGTPAFAAPEVVLGQTADRRADLYGLGATLYALAAGKSPYHGENPEALLRRQQAGPPPAQPLVDARTPRGLIQLVLRLMAPEPSERPRDAREVWGELATMHVAARRPLETRLKTSVMVGRERELAMLEQRLVKRDRGSRVVIVSGGPGIGKSVLVRELAARAALDGRKVVAFSCAGLEGPGAVAIALSRRFAAEAQAKFDSHPGLTQDARTALEDGEGPLGEADLDSLVEAASVWEGMVEPRSGASVILLDDADRLDPISRFFIRRLILRPKAPPAVWVCTRREGLHGDDERVLLDARVAEAIELGHLNRKDLERLVAVRLHEPAPENLNEFLWSRSAGHPGLSVELLLLAAAHGAIRESDSGLVADPEALNRLPWPESFETSQLGRFRALPEVARRMGAGLAVLRTPVISADLLRLVKSSAAVLMSLIETGLASEDAEGRIRLASQGLSERILESLDVEERRALHRRALELPDLPQADRFHHLSGAGEVEPALGAAEAIFETHPYPTLAVEVARFAETHALERAALWHERAGRELFARGRHQSAIVHLERALELEPQGPSWLERLHLLSTAYLRAGNPAEVARVIRLALKESPPAALRSRLLTNEAGRLQSLGEIGDARAAAEEALALAERAADDEAIGNAAHSLVYSFLALQDYEAADSMVARATEAHQRAGNTFGQIRAIGARAALAHARQRLDEAERLYHEALARARSAGHRLAIEELLINLAVVFTESGKWGPLRQTYAEAARLALEDHRPRGAAVATANLAQIDGLAGRPRAARRQARVAIRLTRAHVPRLEAAAWRSLAQAERIAGRRRRAERAAHRALDLAMASGMANEIDWCRIEYVRCLIGAGRGKEASELLERSLSSSTTGGSVAHTIMRAIAGHLAVDRGDHAAATAHLAAADAWLKDRTAPYASAFAHGLRAALPLSRGRAAEGIVHAEKALSAFLALPAPVDRAAAALEFGRLALAGRTGGNAPVERWLELAAAGFERLGDRHGRERVLELLVQWLRRPSVVDHRAGDRGLIESVSQLLNSLTDLHEFGQRAMELVVEQLDAERGVLLLADPETGKLVPMTEYGAIDSATRSEAMGYSRRVVQRVAASGGSLLIGDAPSDPRGLSESMVDLKLRSIVCVPLYLGGKVMGAVYLDDSRRPQAFSDADRGVLEGFAHLMAVAIEKGRGHEEIRRANEQLVGENLSLRQEVAVRFKTHRLIGSSQEMQRVLAVVERAALTNSTVMVTGENGTGKELIARILHHSGKRRLRPFVAVNCGAIPQPLLETELFGILPNVATGVRGRDGRFKQADGGTLFLDEVGDMPLAQQVALLSAISNREITPVGGGKPFPVDVRIIAATNRNLTKLVEEGSFREDLYYRLNVIHIEVPPLRERKADIPSLAHHFVAHFAKVQERPLPRLLPEFLAALMQSDWPGNVRELQNYIERVMAMNPGNVLRPVPLPRDLESRAAAPKLGRSRRLPDMVADLERRLVEEALSHARGNQCQAARELGVPEQAVRYRIRKYGIGPPRQKQRVRQIWRRAT